MKIKILCISDSDKHFTSAIEEYIKRLDRDLEIVSIKPEKNGSREQIINKETDKLIERLEKDRGYKVLLSKDGTQCDTVDMTKIIQDENVVTFIIWGPYGFNEEKFEGVVQAKIAFGSITLPHGLAKLTLLEQVYRAKSIIEWREYHY